MIYFCVSEKINYRNGIFFLKLFYTCPKQFKKSDKFGKMEKNDSAILHDTSKFTHWLTWKIRPTDSRIKKENTPRYCFERYCHDVLYKLNYCSYNYLVKPELYESGHIHFHIGMQIYNMVYLYKELLPTLRTYGFVTFERIKHLEANLRYLKKDKEMMCDLFEIHDWPICINRPKRIKINNLARLDKIIKNDTPLKGSILEQVFGPKVALDIENQDKALSDLKAKSDGNIIYCIKEDCDCDNNHVKLPNVCH